MYFEKITYAEQQLSRSVSELFDAQVQPVVQNGSQIWGLDKAAVHIEKVYSFAFRKF